MSPMKDTGIRRYQYVIGYAILVAAFVFVVFRQEQQANKLERVVASNQAVICAQKENAAQQLAATQQFLKEHPQGIAGISRRDLVTSEARQRQFLAAFSDAEC